MTAHAEGVSSSYKLLFMDMHTQQLRRQINAQRRSQPIDVATESASKICNSLCKLRAIHRAKSIGIYLAAFGEVNCDGFMERMLSREKSLFAPILRKNQLLFAPLHLNTVLRHNQFGIAEPVYKSSQLRKPSELDVVITPLVAFDTHLNRLGMGGGYYDRSFAFKKRRNHLNRPRMIGLAYSFQRIDALSPQTWDVPLDVAITEKESYGSY